MKREKGNKKKEKGNKKKRKGEKSKKKEKEEEKRKWKKEKTNWMVAIFLPELATLQFAQQSGRCAAVSTPVRASCLFQLTVGWKQAKTWAVSLTVVKATHVFTHQPSCHLGSVTRIFIHPQLASESRGKQIDGDPVALGGHIHLSTETGCPLGGEEVYICSFVSLLRL